VVITGLNMHEVGAMVFPNVLACRDLAGLPPDAPGGAGAGQPRGACALPGHAGQVVRELNWQRQPHFRLCLLSEPPTIDRGEITDKGSINQRAVLTHRAGIVEALHADTLPGMLKPAH
jgi:feruloyl-CoA synthase